MSSPLHISTSYTGYFPLPLKENEGDGKQQLHVNQNCANKVWVAVFVSFNLALAHLSLYLSTFLQNLIHHLKLLE